MFASVFFITVVGVSLGSLRLLLHFQIWNKGVEQMVGLRRYGAELVPPSLGSPQFPTYDALVVSDALSCEMPLRKFER